MNKLWLGAIAGVFALAAVAVGQPADNGGGGDELSQSYRQEASGDYVSAARTMRGVADAQSRKYFLRLRLAYLQLMAGLYGDAAENYRLAATLEPAAVEPLLGVQQALLALERFDLAEKVGREVFGKDPKNYLGLSRLAWAQYRMGDFKAAADSYQKVLTLYPGDVDMRAGLGHSLLGQGKKNEAADVFRDVLAMVPGHQSATMGMQAVGK